MKGARGTVFIMVVAAILASTLMFQMGSSGEVPPTGGSLSLPVSGPGEAHGNPLLHAPMDPPFSANIKISDDNGTQGQNEVSIASDTNGNLHAGWNDNRLSTGGPDYRCAFTGSTDGGLTWSANYLYKGPEPECGDPVVVEDHQGGLYRLGMSFDRNGNTATLLVSRSVDGGVTWGAWNKVVDSSDTGGFNDKPWMAAYGDNVYVTWTVFGGGTITFIRSTDGGATWGGMKSLGGGQGSCIVTDGSGNIYLGWGTSTIRFTKSTDGGTTFSSIQTIGNGGSGGSNPRSAPLPGCAVDDAGQNVYFTWAGNTGGSEDIWVVHSGDGGTTWDTQVKVNDDTSNARQIMPWIALDGAGTAHVGWTDWRNGVVDAYYSNSSDGGQTWVANMRITDAAGNSASFQGDYQGMTVTPSGRVVFSWCDTRNGDTDIYIAYADIGNKSGGGGGQQKLARIEITPANATVKADQTLQYTARGVDTKGNPMNITPTWEVTGGSIDATGLYTPDLVGTYTVYANDSGVSGWTRVTVIPGQLHRIDVTPPQATITADDTLLFSASGSDIKGNDVPVTPTWEVTGGSIDATGLYTPDLVGTYTVYANVSSVSGSARVTVTHGALAYLTISPTDPTIRAGNSITFTASGTDARGNAVPLTPTWSATSGSITPAGTYSNEDVGTFTIFCNASGSSASTSVTVIPGMLSMAVLTPTNASLIVGESIQFKVAGYDAYGNGVTNITVLWNVTGSVGSVDQNGRFTAETTGTGRVVASVSSEGVTLQVSASVTISCRTVGSMCEDQYNTLMTSVLILIVVAAVVAAVAVLLLRRRRAAPAEAPPAAAPGYYQAPPQNIPPQDDGSLPPPPG